MDNFTNFNMNTTMYETVVTSNCSNHTYTGNGVSARNTFNPISPHISFPISTIFFHAGGLILLFMVKRRRISSTTTNNMVPYTNVTLLILLSICELSYGFFYTVFAVCEITKQQYAILLSAFLLKSTTMSMSLASIYLITLNRLIGTVYPLWYRSVMTKKKLCAVVVCVNVVVIAFVVGGNVLIMFSTNFWWIGIGIVSFIFFLYFIFCFFAYVKIFFTILRSRWFTETITVEDNNTTLRFVWLTIRKQGYVVPLFITLTYLLFVVLPIIAMAICHANGNFSVMVLQVWAITSQLNNISDALIYIFGEKDIRAYLKNKIARNTNVDNNSVEMEVNSITT